MHDRGPGAGEGHGGQRVDTLGQLHDGGAPPQDNHLGPRSRQRRLLGGGAVHPIGLAVDAQGRLPVRPAWNAGATGDGRGPHDRIVHQQRHTVGVFPCSRAEFGHAAEPFMSQDQRRRNRQVPLLQVKVGPTDTAEVAGDDQAALGSGRHRELVDHQRLAEAFQDDCAATHARPSQSRRRAGSAVPFDTAPGGRVTPESDADRGRCHCAQGPIVDDPCTSAGGRGRVAA